MLVKKKSVSFPPMKTIEARLWDAANMMRDVVPPADYMHVFLCFFEKKARVAKRGFRNRRKQVIFNCANTALTKFSSN